MKFTGIILGGLLLVGCASKPEPHTAVIPGGPYPQPKESSALVFDPRLPEGPAVELAREPRQRSAYVGYDELTTTYSYLRVDDRQRADGDHYERRAIIESVGVRVR